MVKAAMFLSLYDPSWKALHKLKHCFSNLHCILMLFWISVTAILAGILYFSQKRRINRHGLNQLPPKSPFLVPYLDHAWSLLTGPTRFAATLTSRCKTPIPVRFDIFGFHIILVRGSANIRTLLNTHDIFIFNKLQARFLSKVLFVNSKAVATIRNDDSGFGVRPHPGSVTSPQKRILRMQHENTFMIISRTGVSDMLNQFIESFENRILTHGMNDESRKLPDLYQFLQTISFGAMTETLCGPELLKLSPDFERYFWEYDYNIDYLMKFPSFLQPAARNARSKCLDAMKLWRQSAMMRSNGTEYCGQKLWHETWGMKCMRLRHDMYDRFPEFDDHARAACDFALLWAASVNAVPIFYWFMLPILRQLSLFERCMSEMREALLPYQGGFFQRFDANILMQQPTLLSILSEALRLSVTMHLFRSTSKDTHLDTYLIQRDSAAFVSCHMEHMDSRAWSSIPGTKFHPVEQFWPERFLQYPEAGPNTSPASPSRPLYTVDGLENCFMPFGGGIHECPGRNFAKRAILVVAAMIFDSFEIQLEVPKEWEQKYDFHAYGYSTLRPALKTPFQIRRRQVS